MVSRSPLAWNAPPQTLFWTAVDVEFDEDAADVPAEGLADKGAYAGCAGDVGTGRAAHDGADDVVEQACGKLCHNDSLK